MNRFTEKPLDSRFTCSGCGETYTRESVHGVNCPECESYLAASDAMLLNLAVHLERFRERHGLTRKAAIQAAMNLISLREELFHTAMDGYSWTEIRKAEKEEVTK